MSSRSMACHTLRARIGNNGEDHSARYEIDFLSVSKSAVGGTGVHNS